MREYRDERVIRLEKENAALLEALERIIAYHDTGAVLAIARAAIRQAKGESHG